MLANTEDCESSRVQYGKVYTPVHRICLHIQSEVDSTGKATNATVESSCDPNVTKQIDNSSQGGRRRCVEPLRIGKGLGWLNLPCDAAERRIRPLQLPIC